MNILETLFLNFIFILFPLFCYYIYFINEQNIGRKTSDILFDVALFSTLYLILKIDTEYIYIKAMFMLIPLLVAHLSRKKSIYISLSLLIGLYYFCIFNVNIYLIALEMIVYFLLFYLLKKNNISNSTKITFFVIIKITFVLYEFNYFKIDNFKSLKEIILVSFAYYAITQILCYLIKKSEKIVSLHLTIKELEREKQLRNSLFKITHEIKNPLAVCKGYFDMCDYNNKDHVTRYIPIIRQEVERTITLINDFMNLTKLDVDKKKMDISLLLNDISEITMMLSNEKKIDFKYDVSEEEIYIEGDYDRLKQVLINIVKNSIESIPTTRKGLIRLDSKINQNNLVITISDNGVGMDKQTKSKVGEAFFTTKKNGTGLGIKLSKEILEAHEGELHYRSSSKTGTKAIITIPLKKSLS